MTFSDLQPGVLWLRTGRQRPVVEAHIRHVEGSFAAAGWRVSRAVEAPICEGPLAVLDDPWMEPLPALAAFMARAHVPESGLWRLPRVFGEAGEQGWRPQAGPYTLRDYERLATPSNHRPGQGKRFSSPAPCTGFAVAAAGEVQDLVAAGWPPSAERLALIEGACLYRYGDPAKHPRLELDPFIPEDVRLLVDIGCGHGQLGERHRRPGRRVVGIEPDWHLARQAATRLDLVLPATAEAGLRALGQRPDCLIFADVLEHTPDPQTILATAAEVLAESGRIIVSLPNTAWAPVLAALIAGRWDPTLAGVQARDHLVPMTPHSFSTMAAECGLETLSLTPLPIPLPWRLRLLTRIAAMLGGGSAATLGAPQWIAVLRRRL